MMVVGAVELAVDSRTTPLLEVLASTSLLDDPMGVMSCVQPRGGSGACNISSVDRGARSDGRRWKSGGEASRPSSSNRLG